MSKQFEIAFERTRRFEGGWSDDPADRGGKTKYGITEAVWCKFGGNCAIEDITLNQAKDLYFEVYWQGACLDILAVNGVPQDLLSEIFDGCVNHGVCSCIRRLQTAYNIVKVDGPDLVVDGVIGRITLAALSGFCGVGRHYCDSLLAAIRFERAKLYTSLSIADPVQRKFIRGWMRRLV
jgi:lysozyme family protein